MAKTDELAQARKVADAFKLWCETHPREVLEMYARAEAAARHPSTRQRGATFVDSRGRPLARGARVRCPDGGLGRVQRMYAKSNRAVIRRDDGEDKMVMCHRLTLTRAPKTEAA